MQYFFDYVILQILENRSNEFHSQCSKDCRCCVYILVKSFLYYTVAM